MRYLTRLCQAALLLFPLSLKGAFFCSDSWTGAVDNTWNNGGNWVLGCIPDSFSNTATFNSPTAPSSIDLNITPTLAALTFDTYAQSYTILGNGRAMRLTLVNVFSGTHYLQDVNLVHVGLSPLNFDLVGTLELISGSHVILPAGSSNLLGSGTLLLDNTSTFLASSVSQRGTTTFVNDGTVTVTSYALSGGATASGTGSYLADFFNGGNVVPGNTIPGPLFIDLYTQTSSGSLTIPFLDKTHFGVLNTFSSSLDGTLVLQGTPASIQLNQVYTVLNSTTPISGYFSQVLNQVSPYLEPVVFILPNSVAVEFLFDFPGYISPRDAIFSTQNQINYLLLRKIDKMLVTGCCDCGFNGYLAPLGSSGAVHGKDNFVGYSFYTAGFIVGGEYTSPFGGLGVAVDYEHLNLIGKRHWGWVDVNRLHADFYGAVQLFENLYVDGILGVGHDWHDISRREYFGLSTFARSFPHSTEWNALLGLEWVAHLFQLTFVPFVDYQYQFLDVKRTVETASDPFYALTFDPQRYSSHKSLLGLRLNVEQSTLPFCLLAEVNFAWSHEFGTTERWVTSSFLPLLNPSIGRNTFLAGFDVETPLSETSSIEFSYEFEGNTRYLNNFFYLSLNTSF